MRPDRAILSLTAAWLAVPSAALAHPGHAEGGHFLMGVAHPLTGADHLIAMVLVGLLAAQLGGRALWLVPAAFVSAAGLGAALGVAGLTQSIVEIGIGLSVVMLGALVAAQVRLPVVIAMALVASMALFHGYAHGAEAPATASLTYFAGFLASTAMLHAAGVGVGLGFARMAQGIGGFAWRATGAAGAGAGLLLLAAM